MSQYTTNYGTYTTGKPVYQDRCYTRKDLWVGNDGYEYQQQVFCLDINDNSPWQMERETSKCGACWHGFTHTTQKHNHNVANGLV